ncbi:hypothetical protein [Candidatus Cardinium hertigii]|uniref:Alanine--tRNA ligase n=1 Tax=Candidatus Cardinium hertigii TaxID=247481 RepID=A0A2Z3L7V5_9BACT|nr:hypothetical protein [Candidatus Cardinium hertigii]AWN81519.1 hypothetical protein DK880_00185 [Candidatus Cardinium hertigii]
MSYLKSSDILQIERIFKKECQKFQYNWQGEYDLICNDGVLFRNSTISGFLPDIIKNRTLIPTALSQTCLRERVAPDYLHVFNMLGVVAMESELFNILLLTLNFFRSLGYTSDRLIIYGPAGNSLWMDLINSQANLRYIELLHNKQKYWVEWNFKNISIKGVRITIALDQVNRVVPVGNIIILSNAQSRKYIDAGFGIECIEAYPYGGVIEQIPRFSQLLSLVGAKQGFDFLRQLFAADLLITRGLLPGAKGHRHVLRCFLRKLIKNRPNFSVILPKMEKVLAADFSKLHKYLTEEAFALRTNKKSTSLAFKFYTRNPQMYNDAHLWSTFGLKNLNEKF